MGARVGVAAVATVLLLTTGADASSAPSSFDMPGAAPAAATLRLAATPTTCLPGRAAGAVDAAFQRGNQRPLGALGGFDEPTIYHLPDGRSLWLVHDAYLDVRGNGGPYQNQSYLHNVALAVGEQAGRTCVDVVYREGAGGVPVDFEPGPDPAQWPGHMRRTNRRWWWAIGGGIDADGNLSVLWAEMVQTRRSHAAPEDGIARHPDAVWLATYDPVTLERRSFVPAPDPGTGPMFGVGTVDDPSAGVTYLFGNALDRDLTRSGGYQAGPHPSTISYLARVPLGRYDQHPEYWTPAGWSPDRRAAAPIQRDGWTEWVMQPQLVDGRWRSVTKVDGWWGTDLVVQAAEHPWGPWSTVHRERFVPSLGPDPDSLFKAGMRQDSYTPVIEPAWSSADRLAVVVSQNGWDWMTVCHEAERTPYYWPTVRMIQLDGS